MSARLALGSRAPFDRALVLVGAVSLRAEGTSGGAMRLDSAPAGVLSGLPDTVAAPREGVGYS